MGPLTGSEGVEISGWTVIWSAGQGNGIAGVRLYLSNPVEAVNRHGQGITESKCDMKNKFPAGWKFRTKVLDKDLTIGAIDGVARIVQDNLEPAVTYTD